MLGLSDEIDPTAAVIAPRGQVSEGGALRWFRRFSEGVFDVDDVVFRAGNLAEFIGWAASAYDLGGRRIVAAGFSNGANIALATGILFPGLFDTTIAFSGMYPFGARAMSTHPASATVKTASATLETASTGLAVSQDLAVSAGLAAQRFVLLNGDSDPMAPAVSVDRLVAELTRTGADVARHTRTGGHGITSDDLRIARAAYRAAAARGGGS